MGDQGPACCKSKGGNKMNEWKIKKGNIEVSAPTKEGALELLEAAEANDGKIVRSGKIKATPIKSIFNYVGDSKKQQLLFPIKLSGNKHTSGNGLSVTHSCILSIMKQIDKPVKAGRIYRFARERGCYKKLKSCMRGNIDEKSIIRNISNFLNRYKGRYVENVSKGRYELKRGTNGQ